MSKICHSLTKIKGISKKTIIPLPILAAVAGGLFMASANNFANSSFDINNSFIPHFHASKEMPSNTFIDVSRENALLTAVDDIIQSDEDHSVSIEVLTKSTHLNINNSDADNNDLSLQIITAPNQGSAIVDELSTVVIYSPNPNYHGSDSFSYMLKSTTDGTSKVATVKLNIHSVNDAPQAADDTAALTEDRPQEITVLANDSDMDSKLNVRTVEVVSTPSNGNTSIDTNSGRITYTPSKNFNGEDSFSYRVQDQEGRWSEAAKVQLSVSPVNDAPVANKDSLTTDEDSTITASLLDNDSDLDDNIDSSSLVLVSDVSNGVLVNKGDGNITYTPNSNFYGTDSFTYTVNDLAGVSSNTAAVTITINPVNDIPSISSERTITGNEDSPFSFTPKASDIENDSLSFDVKGLPDWASFDSGTGSITGTPSNDNVGSYALSISVSDGKNTTEHNFEININNTNDAPTIHGTPVKQIAQGEHYSFVPTANDIDVEDELVFSIENPPPWATFNARTGELSGHTDNSAVGTAEGIVIHVSDGSTTTSLPAFDLSVTNINDSPVAKTDTYHLAEGEYFQVARKQGVLANDIDVDGDQLSISLTSSPQNGQLNLAADGSFRYVHSGKENSSDSFSYKISDGQVESPVVKVNLNIAAVNDAPILVSQAPQAKLSEGGRFIYKVGVTDPDSDVQVELVDGPDWLTLNEAKVLQGRAPEDSKGIIPVMLKVSDGQYSVDQRFELNVLPPQTSALELYAEWGNLPARVGDTLELKLRVEHNDGPDINNGLFTVKIIGTFESLSMNECVEISNSEFGCTSSTSEGQSNEFTLLAKPGAQGDVVAELRFIDLFNNQVIASGISDTTVAAQSVGQSNARFPLENVTALETIELIEDGNHELIAGTSQSQSVKLLDFDLGASEAEVLGEIRNLGETEAIQVVDINQDGLSDVLVINSSGDATAVYYNLGNLRFEANALNTSFVFASQGQLIDLNNDDFPELILGGDNENLYIYRNNAGLFDEPPYILSLPLSVHKFAIPEENQTRQEMSGKVIVADSETLSMFSFDLLDSNQSLSKTAAKSSNKVWTKFHRKTALMNELSLPGITSFQLADVNGDRVQELLVSSTHENGSSQDSGIAIVEINREPLRKITELGSAAASAIRVANFNNDAYPDLLVANENSSYKLFIGTGRIENWGLGDTVIQQSASTLALSDTNNDDLDDIILYDSQGAVEVYTSEGDGNMGVSADIQLATTLDATDAEDFSFSFVATITNTSGADAENIRLRVDLPTEVSVVALPENCLLEEARIHCSQSLLEAGESTDLDIDLSSERSLDGLAINTRVDSDALDTDSDNNSKTDSLSGLFNNKKAQATSGEDGGGGALGGIALVVLAMFVLITMRKKIMDKTLPLLFAAVVFTGNTPPEVSAETKGGLKEKVFSKL